MRKIALLFALVAPCAVAAPGDTWGVATVTSYHFASIHYNQTNLGAGFERETSIARLSVVAGAYRNSYYKTSAYAGVLWTPLALGAAHFGVIAGAVSGYNSPIALVPTVAVEGRRFGANVYYAPAIGSDCAVLGLQVKMKF